MVRLPSGEQRRVLSVCRATVGSLSNPQHKNRKLGKAGASRWMGRRPTVRAPCPSLVFPSLACMRSCSGTPAHACMPHCFAAGSVHTITVEAEEPADTAAAELCNRVGHAVGWQMGEGKTCVLQRGCVPSARY